MKMRYKVRKGVFETNSSSTHSYMLSNEKLVIDALMEEFNAWVHKHYNSDFHELKTYGEIKMTKYQRDLYESEILSKYPDFPKGVEIDEDEITKEYNSSDFYHQQYTLEQYLERERIQEAERVFNRVFCHMSGEGGTLEMGPINILPTYEGYCRVCEWLKPHIEDAWSTYKSDYREKLFGMYDRWLKDEDFGFDETLEKIAEMVEDDVTALSNYLTSTFGEKQTISPISEDKYNALVERFRRNAYEIDIDYGYHPLIKHLTADPRWEFVSEGDLSKEMKTVDTEVGFPLYVVSDWVFREISESEGSVLDYYCNYD